MPQGKLRVKTQLPSNVKRKATSKGPAISRKNRPIAVKKKKFQEADKLKKKITKNVNEAMEVELRARVNEGSKTYLSKKKPKPAVKPTTVGQTVRSSK